jgi:hypothetical protein
MHEKGKVQNYSPTFAKGGLRGIYSTLLNTPTVRSRDEVLPASSLHSSKRQGNEVEAVNTPTVRSWEVY